MNLGSQLFDSRERQRIDSKAKSRRKTHRPEHAQLVFLEALLGISDRANDARIQVGAPADKIQHVVAVQRIHEQSVDGEVAPLHVFFRRLGILHLVGMSAVGIDSIAAKRRHLNGMRMFGWKDVAFAVFRDRHQHNPELRAHRVGLGKDSQDLVRNGISGDVVVGGFKAQQHVAHTSPGEVSLKAVAAKLANHIDRMLFHE